LDADVRSYVPEFPQQKAIVTTRQLLCHQGGIRHYANGKIVPNERKYTETNPFESVILAIDEFKDSPLIAPPGERFAYSTHGYVLLSAVVERAGKQPFAAQISERICRPLGLESLRPDYQWSEIPHRALGYMKREKEIERSTDTDVSWKLGGGGYISTIDDLALWCAALARGELLKRETWEAASTPQQTKSGTKSTYGLGFQVKGAGADMSIGHSGAQEKTRTFLIAYPQQKIGAVAMTNSEYGEPARVVHALLKELFPQVVDGQSD
jgi:CubicO group peptidase (beta-lactamase class C family)